MEVADITFPLPPFKKFISDISRTLTPSQSDLLPVAGNIFKTKTREREMFYLTTHSTHFIYGYLASGIWLRTILIAREETRCRHMGYSFRLAARVLLYAPSHRQDSTYHGLCYTSRGALAGTRNSSMGPPHEVSIRRPIAPWANALPLSYVPLQERQGPIGHRDRQRKGRKHPTLIIAIFRGGMNRQELLNNSIDSGSHGYMVDIFHGW